MILLKGGLTRQKPAHPLLLSFHQPTSQPPISRRLASKQFYTSILHSWHKWITQGRSHDCFDCVHAVFSLVKMTSVFAAEDFVCHFHFF